MRFTRQQLNRGPLLNFSVVVKCGNVWPWRKKLSMVWQDFARQRGQLTNNCPFTILYNFTTLLQFSKGPLLNFAHVKGALSELADTAMATSERMMTQLAVAVACRWSQSKWLHFKPWFGCYDGRKKKQDIHTMMKVNKEPDNEGVCC